MTITKEGALASFYTVNKAPIKHLKVYFSPKQSGEGEPSLENVRSIEGWKELIFSHSNKSLVKFGSIGPLNQLFNGYNSQWIIYNNKIYIPVTDRNSYYTYSCYIDNTNGAEPSQVQVWFKDITNTKYLHVVAGNGVAAGTAGWSKVTFKPSPTDYFLGLGITLKVGAIASKGTLELGNNMTEYEPYEGSSFIIQLPSHTKNLFDPHCEMFNYPSTYTINTDGSVTQKQSDGRGWTQSNFPSIHLEAGTYTLTCSDGNTFNVSISTDNFATQTRLPNGGGTFTLTEDVDVRIKHSASSYPTTFTVQLEKNSSATAYEPFDNVVYGGYIDFITGELVQTHYISQINKVNKYSTDEGYFWYTTTNTINTPAIKAENAGLVADRFKVVPGLGVGNAENQITFYSNGIIRWKENENMSLTEYESYLTSNPFTICYELATPIVLGNISPTELQSFVGQNNIWSEADKVEVEYDLAESNDELYRRRNVILNSSPHVESASETIALFDTDMKAPLKELKAYFTSIQEGSGNPSLENERPIHGFTGLLLHHDSKNIIDLQSATWSGDSNKVSYSISGGDVTITAKTSGRVGFVGSQYSIKQDVPYAWLGKKVYFGCSDVIHNNPEHICTVVVEFRDESGTRITDPTVITTNGEIMKARSFTIPSNTKEFSIMFRIAQNCGAVDVNVGDYVIFKDFYIRYPADIAIYEPYFGESIPIEFPVMKNLVALNRSPAHNQDKTAYVTITKQTPNELEFTTGGTTTWECVRLFYTLPAGTYTAQIKGEVVNGESEGYKPLVSFYKFGDSNPYTAMYANAKTTFTINEETIFDIRIFGNNSTPVQRTLRYYDFQIEKGSSDSLYEPYGTAYGGYVDLIKGEIVQTHFLFQRKVADMNNNDSYPGWKYCADFKVVANYINNTDNGYKYNLISNIGDRIWYNSKDTNPTVFIYSDMRYGMTQTEWKANYPDLIMQWLLPLAEPIHYPLTPQTLKAFKGTNNIWSNANGSTEVTYWTH